MKHLKLVVSEFGDYRNSMLVIEETGEQIARVKNVVLNAGVDYKGETYITMYPINVEVVQSILEWTPGQEVEEINDELGG